jgi:hypothetical protein
VPALYGGIIDGKRKSCCNTKTPQYNGLVHQCNGVQLQGVCQCVSAVVAAFVLAFVKNQFVHCREQMYLHYKHQPVNAIYRNNHC